MNNIIEVNHERIAYNTANKAATDYLGEIMREDVLPELGISVSEAARILGISRQQIGQ